ncbi:MAG: hypothetical protein AAGB23_05440 [Pseudomonadota bacterium]
MKRKTAAEYCDLSESAFEREVGEGRLPGPIEMGSRDHWCRKTLDKALDALTGAEDVPDYRQKLLGEYGSQAA